MWLHSVLSLPFVEPLANVAAANLLAYLVHRTVKLFATPRPGETDG